GRGARAVATSCGGKLDTVGPLARAAPPSFGRLTRVERRAENRRVPGAPSAVRWRATGSAKSSERSRDEEKAFRSVGEELEESAPDEDGRRGRRARRGPPARARARARRVRKPSEHSRY